VIRTFYLGAFAHNFARKFGAYVDGRKNVSSGGSNLLVFNATTAAVKTVRVFSVQLCTDCAVVENFVQL